MVEMAWPRFGPDFNEQDIFVKKFSLISCNGLSKARFYVRPGKQVKTYILIITKLSSTYKITLKHIMFHSFKSQ